ncbi:unnamed protein product [Cylindrotheca closterium]|uniref:Uncharacterized protein n=1 Tax=Cylindrotheca closterium TaxID=2856 RepID=A0AAD2FZS9_9STRA|nr:unnamed protein product [Cylindrotheca closterium]
MFKTLSLFLLLQGASAMYVRINGYECSEKAMSLTLSKICNEESTCLLGENASIEGYLNYYGMVDEFGMSADSSAYVDFSLKFTQNGAAIYNHNIYSLQQMPLCSDSLTASDGGSCPSGGRYSFQQTLYLPPLDNQLKDWGYSGFNGRGELTAYMGEDNGSTVLGYCTFDVTTTSSGAFAKAPSGRAVLYGVFGTVTFLLVLAVMGFLCAKREAKVAMVNKVSKSTRKAVKRAKQAVGVSTSPNDFEAMEEKTNAEAKQNWKLDWDSKAAVGKHPAQKQIMNV